MLCVIEKKFDAAGSTVVPGQVVDVSEWKNAEFLLKNNYMRKATKEERVGAERSRPTVKKGTGIKIRRASR